MLAASCWLFLIIVPSVSAQLPEGKGKDVVERICNSCHGSDQITSHRMSKKEWADTVDRMQDNGANPTDDEVTAILDYLATHFGLLINVNKASAEELQDGLSLSAKDAQAIVDYRQHNSPFGQLSDLAKVPGLDTEAIEKEKDNITF